jgi:uncharacterized membrane protein
MVRNPLMYTDFQLQHPIACASFRAPKHRRFSRLQTASESAVVVTPITGKEVRAGGSTNFVVRPNRSLSAAGIAAMCLACSALALTVGIGLALVGAWMVLPFAGVEIVVIGVLCRWLYRHLDDCEVIAVGSERIGVRQRCGRAESYEEFQCYWTRVVLERGNERRPSRLWIGSHGRYLRLAEHINEGDRRRLADALRDALRAPGGGTGRGGEG